MVKDRHFESFKKGLPRVDGKVIAITGTTSGTGFVAAQTVAELGAEVILLNRPSKRSVDSLARLQEAVPQGKFVSIDCDLQDFASVRSAANKIREDYTKLYALGNNAGIMATKDEATVDGYDTQMQTNHLSHFLLTAELYPLLEEGAKAFGDARIVNHSSFGRTRTPNKQLEEKYFQRNGGNLGGDGIGLMSGACFERYFQTKLANTVFMHALDKRIKKSDSKVRVISAHPGGSDTNLGDGLKLNACMTCLLGMLTPFIIQSAADGSMGLLKGLIDPLAESGVLYGPKNDGTKGLPVAHKPKPYETDEAAMEMLWRTSEEATGVKFKV